MYQLRVDRFSQEDKERFKRICKQMMLRDGYTVSDMSRLTGYSVQTLYNFFSNGKDTKETKRSSRYVAAALADVLEISVGGRK